MQIRLGVVLICFAIVPIAGSAADDPCDGDSHLQDVQCLGKQIQALEKELDVLYRATLSKLPDSVPTDNRKGKPQLVKAQEAWRKYVDQHCDFIGGIQGGSNLWVTDFATRCELDEIKKRIEFFKNVPWGTH
jgi:uncharacterized protein YecT (DUF1311 family)